MNVQMLMFAVVVAMSGALVFLQGWLLLLDDSGAQPMWFLIGLMCVVGGLLNIRRIRMEQRDR